MNCVAVLRNSICYGFVIINSGVLGLCQAIDGDVMEVLFSFLYVSPGGWLYQFPFAAVANCYQIGDLKQHRFMILDFWRSHVCNGTYRAKIKLLTGPCSLWRL